MSSTHIGMYVISLTHSWLGLVGMSSLVRFGNVGRPWRESVVFGLRMRMRTLRLFPVRDDLRRYQPTVSLSPNSRLYINQSFGPPIQGRWPPYL